MGYTWNWHVFLEPSPEGGTYLSFLLDGLLWTLATAAAAWLLALAAGSAVGVMRTLPWRWARGLGTAYVEIFRNIPVLVQLFLWYFVVPEIIPAAWGNWLKALPDASFYTAVTAIGLYMSSRVAEQVRAGIQSLPPGQQMAAAALGLSPAQAYRHVLLPVAYRLILPPLTSEMLATIKNTAVAMTIGLLELTNRARAIQEYTFQVFEAFTAAVVIYLALNIAVTCAMRLLEHRLAVPGLIRTK